MRTYDVRTCPVSLSCPYLRINDYFAHFFLCDSLMELNTTLYVNKNLYYIVSYEVKIKKKYCKSIVIDSSKLLHKRHRKIKSDENRKKEKKKIFCINQTIIIYSSDCNSLRCLLYL